MSSAEPTLEDLLALSVKSETPGAKLPPARIQRALTAEDLAAAKETRALSIPAGDEPVSALARIKSTHHHLARVLAEGVNNIEASARTGYSPSRVALLRKDPAFVELIHYYRQTEVDPVYMSVHDTLATLGQMATETLRQRLEEEPDSFKHRELMEIMSASLDRSVAPAKGSLGGKSTGGGSGPVAINVSFVTPDAHSGAPTITITPEASGTPDEVV
jgi:hypothetical protein